MADGILKVGQITNSAGSGNITIGSGVTVNVNRPSFSAYLTADQSIADSTNVKVNLDAELWDTDSAFASNKFTVPAGGAGKYWIYGTCSYVSLTDADQARAQIYKNGSLVAMSRYYQGVAGNTSYQVGNILDLAVSDYIELYALQVSGGAINVDGGDSYLSFLTGYKIGA